MCSSATTKIMKGNLSWALLGGERKTWQCRKKRRSERKKGSKKGRKKGRKKREKKRRKIRLCWGGLRKMKWDLNGKPKMGKRKNSIQDPGRGGRERWFMTNQEEEMKLIYLSISKVCLYHNWWQMWLSQKWNLLGLSLKREIKWFFSQQNIKLFKNNRFIYMKTNILTQQMTIFCDEQMISNDRCSFVQRLNE